MEVKVFWDYEYTLSTRIKAREDEDNLFIIEAVGEDGSEAWRVLTTEADTVARDLLIQVVEALKDELGHKCVFFREKKGYLKYYSEAIKRFLSDEPVDAKTGCLECVHGNLFIYLPLRSVLGFVNVPLDIPVALALVQELINYARAEFGYRPDKDKDFVLAKLELEDTLKLCEYVVAFSS